MEIGEGGPGGGAEALVAVADEADFVAVELVEFLDEGEAVGLGVAVEF